MNQPTKSYAELVCDHIVEAPAHAGTGTRLWCPRCQQMVLVRRVR